MDVGECLHGTEALPDTDEAEHCLPGWGLVLLGQGRGHEYLLGAVVTADGLSSSWREVARLSACTGEPPPAGQDSPASAQASAYSPAQISSTV